MTHCNLKSFELGRVKNRNVFAKFSENHISSFGGIMLLQQIDKKLRLTERSSQRGIGKGIVQGEIWKTASKRAN